jgi:hypothetical protein
MDFNGSIIYPVAGQLSGTDDEKIFLNKEQITEVLSGRQRAFNADFIRYKERDFPSLTIYLFNLGILKKENGEYPSNLKEDNYTATIAHKKPSIGYTISFPLTGNLKGKSSEEIRSLNRRTAYSYSTNRVWEQMSFFNTHVEEDDFIHE